MKHKKKIPTHTLPPKKQPQNPIANTNPNKQKTPNQTNQTNERKGKVQTAWREVKVMETTPTKRQNPWRRGLRVHKGFAHTFSSLKETLSRSGLTLEHTSLLGIKIPACALLFTCQSIQKLLALHYPFPEASIPILLLILAGTLPGIRQTTLIYSSIRHFC